MPNCPMDALHAGFQTLLKFSQTQVETLTAD